MSRWRDPWWRAIGVLVVLLVAGFVMLGFAAAHAHRVGYVPLQFPWALSGGLAGVALVGFAAGAWSIHLSRREDATDRKAWERFTTDAAELAERLRTGELKLPSRTRRRRLRSLSSRR